MQCLKGTYRLTGFTVLSLLSRFPISALQGNQIFQVNVNAEPQVSRPMIERELTATPGSPGGPGSPGKPTGPLRGKHRDASEDETRT